MVRHRTELTANPPGHFYKYFPGQSKGLRAPSLDPFAQLYSQKTYQFCFAWSLGFPGGRVENRHQSPSQVKLSKFFSEVKERMLSRTGPSQTLWKQLPELKSVQRGCNPEPASPIPLPGARSLGGVW